MTESFYVLAGLALLVLGGNSLLKGAVGLSMRLNIPRIIIGMTVVSLATSAPELIVSANAALEGFPDLALGNVIGSNIANLGLVLAVTLLIGHVEVRPSFYVTDWPMLMLASLLFYGFLAWDGVLGRGEGAVMVGVLFLFLIYLLRFQKPVVAQPPEAALSSKPLTLVLAHLAVGGVALWGGSELLISGAVGLAGIFGVSERVIGITVVSVGTSIPELAASVIAMARKEKAISVGNLIGSNIFNLLAVLGITALITPIPVVDTRLLDSDVFWMLGISFLILPLVFFPKGLRLGWRDGLVLLATYATFLYFTL
ncbi:calcium/sodium antiporter [Robiginitalea sp. M366]|uniref:calcium/sodium antiporter n=1 Tax=Robiginitalea aestuariiviva TaxID=3036903 RepID=UPI00240E4B95|nr:calcium/sodium antiporter [Robiginitalea aestuariiviva]MDG1572279.1 calcium/sodium antiporter [Robiginitalea aestuariiviva]